MDLKNNNYYQSKINKSLEYLNDNLGDEISMQQLADKSNFSLFHFQRIYKAITKESPYETLLIEVAARKSGVLF